MHLTATFKLRTSRRKREILDHALREYAELQAWLLTWAEGEIEHIAAEARVEAKSGRVFYPARRIQSLLPPLRECPGEIHSLQRDAARADVAAMLSGYLSLREQGYNAGFPSARLEKVGDYVAALDNLAHAADVDELTWRALAGDLARKRKLLPPAMQFPRMDGAARRRNAALLVDPERGKYFALLFLLPNRHELGELLETQGNLVPLGIEDPAPFTSQARTAIICPLEFSDWHKKKFLASGAVPKVARLYRGRDGDHYLTVAFEMPDPEPIRLTGAMMAVVASETGLVAYAVAGAGGDILDAGDYRPEATELQTLKKDWQREAQRRQRRGRSIAGFSLRRSSKHTFHAVANDLVERAVAYGARILVQAPGRQSGNDGKRRRRPPLIGQVRGLLEYKAELAGLPAPRWASVWRAGDGEWIHLSRVCATCGAILPKGKPRPEFTCPTCGKRDSGVNLAMMVALAAVGD